MDLRKKMNKKVKCAAEEGEKKQPEDEEMRRKGEKKGRREGNGEQ